MGSLPCVIDVSSPAAIDTSVAINLIATGCGAAIVRALPCPLVVVDAVPAKLEEGRRRGRPEADLLGELVAAGLIEIVTLNDPAEAIFEELVVGAAAETLDDGEAATIAYAVVHRAIAIIDERKANRIGRERFPTLRLGSTVDMLAHPSVERSLGREALSHAVLNALQLARMRVLPHYIEWVVLPHYIEWVVKLIGEEHAAACPSLPASVRGKLSPGGP